MGFLADKCTFRLLTRELIETCKPEVPKEKRMRRYPAVLIGRLGVDLHFADKGIGTANEFILKKVKELNEKNILVINKVDKVQKEHIL